MCVSQSFDKSQRNNVAMYDRRNPNYMGISFLWREYGAFLTDVSILIFLF